MRCSRSQPKLADRLRWRIGILGRNGAAPGQLADVASTPCSVRPRAERFLCSVSSTSRSDGDCTGREHRPDKAIPRRYRCRSCPSPISGWAGWALASSPSGSGQSADHGGCRWFARDIDAFAGLADRLSKAASNRNQPAATVAAYALLLTAALLFGVPAGETPDPPSHLRPPKWRTHSPATSSTGDLILRSLRSECWADPIAPAGFSDFASAVPTFTNPSKAPPFLAEALFRAA